MEHLLPALCAARYQPTKLLGRGGFGEVYLAEQVKLGRPVAVKVLNADLTGAPTMVARFTGEARITASLAHPHVVVVIDYGVDEGVPWIVYEYLPGRSLRQRMTEDPPDWPTALVLSSQVAWALDAAHQQGIIHRDIKPDNVIELTPTHVKVTDFGLAKWTEDTVVKTKTGLLIGTPSFIAPELIRGEAPSPASDIYALGILTYMLAVGRSPFKSESPSTILARHLRGDIPRPRGVCPAIGREAEDVIVAAIDLDPSRRFASAAALGAALVAAARTTRSGAALLAETTLAGQSLAGALPGGLSGIGAPPWTNPSRPEPPPILGRTLRQRVTVGLIALALLGGLSILVFLLAQPARLRPTPSAAPPGAASGAPSIRPGPPSQVARRLPPQMHARIDASLTQLHAWVLDRWGELGRLRNAFVGDLAVEATSRQAAILVKELRPKRGELSAAIQSLDAACPDLAVADLDELALVARARGTAVCAWTLAQGADFLARPLFDDGAAGASGGIDIAAIARHLDPKIFGREGLPVVKRYLDAMLAWLDRTARRPADAGPDVAILLHMHLDVSRFTSFGDWKEGGRALFDRNIMQFEHSLDALSGPAGAVLGATIRDLWALGRRDYATTAPATGTNVGPLLAEMGTLSAMLPGAARGLDRFALDLRQWSRTNAQRAPPGAH